MSRLTRAHQKILSNIEEYGWHVLKVMESEDRIGFCYSVGLYKTFQHPEIIIIGLKPELGHILINSIGTDIQNGFTYESGMRYPNILDDFDCLMLQVDNGYYDMYFGLGQWYYQSADFPVLQCIYPTVQGIYPWEKDWPSDLNDVQPILGNLAIR